jgi:hypothetical protein
MRTLFFFSSIDGHEFDVEQDVWEDNDKGVLTQETVQKRGLLRCWNAILPHLQFLRRGRGARRTETFITSIFMFLIFRNQILVTLFALKTNVLPAARDVCTLYRIEHGEALLFENITWDGIVLRWFLRVTVMFNLHTETSKVIEGFTNDHHQCLQGGAYYQRPTHSGLCEQYGTVIMALYILLITALIMPQLVKESPGIVNRLVGVQEDLQDVESGLEALEDKEAANEKAMNENKKAIAELRQELAEVKDKLRVKSK